MEIIYSHTPPKPQRCVFWGTRTRISTTGNIQLTHCGKCPNLANGWGLVIRQIRPPKAKKEAK